MNRSLANVTGAYFIWQLVGDTIDRFEKSYSNVGIEATSNSPAEIAVYIRFKFARWSRLIRKAKMQFD